LRNSSAARLFPEEYTAARSGIRAHPMLLSGIRINTSPTDYFPIEQMQLMRFDGKRWVRFGEVMGS
jgi:hypothetical protein